MLIPALLHGFDWIVSLLILLLLSVLVLILPVCTMPRVLTFIRGGKETEMKHLKAVQLPAQSHPPPQEHKSRSHQISSRRRYQCTGQHGVPPMEVLSRCDANAMFPRETGCREGCAHPCSRVHKKMNRTTHFLWAFVSSEDGSSDTSINEGGACKAVGKYVLVQR